MFKAGDRVTIKAGYDEYLRSRPRHLQLALFDNRECVVEGGRYNPLTEEYVIQVKLVGQPIGALIPERFVQRADE
jgi:hypothetical protein